MLHKSFIPARVRVVALLMLLLVILDSCVISCNMSGIVLMLCVLRLTVVTVVWGCPRRFKFL